jgi:hypothetical protein
MADTTTPATSVGNTTPVVPSPNDLQINLEENTQKIEKQPSTSEPLPSPDINLDLDLNLPEAPKNDDRLKTEDQKNREAEIPTKENTPAENIPTEIPQAKIEDMFVPIPETITPEPMKESSATEQVTKQQQEIQENEISTTITEEITSDPHKELADDMKIIDELNMHESAGGLSPEAKGEVTPKPIIETPKTFDLDAMLGTSTPTTTTAPIIENISNTTKEDIKEIPAEITKTETLQPEIPSLQATGTTEVAIMPTFTLPTTTATIPSAIIGTTVQPDIALHNKTKGVKTLLFVLLFAALGFTTYFILKTMYPVEFENMFGGETQIHASEEVTGDNEMTGMELTGTGLTGMEFTGTSEEMSGIDNGFWELNDLETVVEEPIIPQDNISKLTDYASKWEELLAKGKTLGNNTVIKYGLYISKKSTDLLQKIANDEQIDNLSGYFAQFDQYIAQLETILNPVVENTIEETPTMDEISTPSSETPNESSDMTETIPQATSE